MDMRDRLDPELVAPLDGLMAATGGGFRLSDLAGTRAMLDGMLAGMKESLPEIPGVSSEDMVAEAGANRVAVRVYRPASAGPGAPALLWMHPGGFVIGNIELDDFLCRQIALAAECVVMSVDYRLAPEHPYPAAIDDCMTAWTWLLTAAETLDIDPHRVAVGGGSAGGGLAAALALRVRDGGGHQPCLQVLIYPAINDCNIEQVSERVPENLFWSRENALIGWQAYLENRQGTADVSPYAAPYRAESLSGLAPVFMAVGALDMFVDDCLDFSGRLIAAGVDTALHVYPGAFHAFDAFAPAARVSRQLVSDRDTALQRAFGTAE